MRVQTLSDHAADQIRQAQDSREAAYRQQREAWRAEVERREAAIAGRKAAIGTAMRDRRFFAALGHALSWLASSLSRRPSEPEMPAAGEDEGRFAGGREGEERVQADLSTWLDDRWMLFKGYRNRGGETDLLLLGPTAIVAIEVKTLNGVVHVRGTEWSRDKYDRYGNLVQEGVPVRDAKGRAPSQQVNAVADELQGFLLRRGQPVAVRRAVVLAHENSRLGVIEPPGVDFLGVLQSEGFREQFQNLLRPLPGAAPLNVGALGELVCQDHAFHEQRLAQRRAG